MKYINYKAFWTAANKWSDDTIIIMRSLLFKGTHGFKIYCYIISRYNPNMRVLQITAPLRDDSFIMSAKFSKKLIILTPIFVILSYHQVWNVSFSETSANVINEWSLMIKLLSPSWL